MTNRARLSAVILAGGASSRMGQPKAALRFGASTILKRTIDALRRGFEDIIIVAAPHDLDSLKVPHADVRVIHDDEAYGGPVGALERGLRAASHDLVFACACDLPMLNGAVAQSLCEMLADCDAVIGEIGGKLQPLHAAYQKTRCARGLAQMAARGEKRLTEVASFVKARVLHELELRKLDPELRSFLNVNTPEDYQRALALARGE